MSVEERDQARFSRIDPFGDFFDLPEEARDAFDDPRIEACLRLVGWGVRTGLYSYQRSLDGRSGARVEADGRSLLMMSSYDYLGLIGHPTIEEAAVQAVKAYGTSSGGVRLLTGTNRLHGELEADLAKFKGVDAAVVYTSGYLANMAAITTLVGPADQIAIDEAAHRSLLDGCCLAKARLRTFRHNDANSLEELLRGHSGRTLVVVEGIYSMDGDWCPLPQLVELKRRYRSMLLVDEAHSLGTCGATGRGVDEHFGVDARDVDVWTGSLSKAIPSSGGYVAGSRAIAVLLQHASAPYIFSAALSPSSAAAARAALQVVRSESWRIERLRQNAARLREGLRARGYDPGASQSAVVPVIIGEELHALTVARRLHDEGIYATPVVFPAVARGAARLRLCAMATHSEEDYRQVLDALDRGSR